MKQIHNGKKYKTKTTSLIDVIKCRAFVFPGHVTASVNLGFVPDTAVNGWGS